MSLYALKREYEERRSALVEQLQKNPSLDPATQHQIYGAIKEIENFLKTIEYQINQDQEKNLNVDLSRERPRPMMERTKGAVYHVARGTKKIFTHHIPAAAKSVVAGPKRYFDKKNEEARLRKEIEAEFKARRNGAQLTDQSAAAVTQQQLPEHHVTLEHPHQELAQEANAEPAPPQPVVQETTQSDGQPLPTWNDETVHRTSEHEKRPKAVVHPSKSKNHPSKNAPGKKGGQHKPHSKKDKNNRYHR